MAPTHPSELHEAGALGSIKVPRGCWKVATPRDVWWLPPKFTSQMH